MTTESYISWSVVADDVYDDEGDIIGQDEYVLIEKIWITPSERRTGKARQMLREAIAEIGTERAGMTIKIAALPFGDDPIDMWDLCAFYESEGFSVTDTSGHAVIMEL